MQATRGHLGAIQPGGMQQGEQQGAFGHPQPLHPSSFISSFFSSFTNFGGHGGFKGSGHGLLVVIVAILTSFYYHETNDKLYVSHRGAIRS